MSRAPARLAAELAPDPSSVNTVGLASASTITAPAPSRAPRTPLPVADTEPVCTAFSTTSPAGRLRPAPDFASTSIALLAFEVTA